MINDTQSATLLRGFFERLRRLDDEIAELQIDRRAVLKEAKDAGFFTNVITTALRRARKDPAVILELDGLLETYEAITGTGAGAVGVLTTERGADGTFAVRMASGPDAIASRRRGGKASAFDTQMHLAAMARLAEDG